MQENKGNITDEVIRMVKWLSEHPIIQSRLCEDYSETTPKESEWNKCVRTSKIKSERKYYKIIKRTMAPDPMNIK